MEDHEVPLITFEVRLLGGALLDHVHRGADRVFHAHRLLGQHDPAGLDLGHVEDIVDQLEKMRARLVYVGGVLA